MTLNQNNQTMIEQLVDQGFLNNDVLIKSFHAIDRKDFVLLEDDKTYAIDQSIKIGYGQRLTAPLIIAFILERLALEYGHKVLNIGTGSGYSTAIIAKRVGQIGYVFGLESRIALVELGREKLIRYNIHNAHISKATHKLGIQNKTFDRILMWSNLQTVPMDLLSQLAVNGKMILPIEGIITLIEHKDNQFYQTQLAKFQFEDVIL